MTKVIIEVDNWRLRVEYRDLALHLGARFEIDGKDYTYDRVISAVEFASLREDPSRVVHSQVMLMLGVLSGEAARGADTNLMRYVPPVLFTELAAALARGVRR